MAELITDQALPPPGSEGEPTEKKRRGRPPGSTNKVNLDKLEADIKDKLDDTVCVPLAIASPLASAYLLTRNEKNAKALIGLAKRYPKFRGGLEKFVAVSNTGDLAISAGGVMAAFMVDMGRMDSTAFLPSLFKLDEIYADIYGDSSEEERGGFIGARGLAAQL